MTIAKRVLLSLCLVVLAAAAFASQAAPAAHAAPAAPKIAQSCTGDVIVADSGTDYNYHFDTVWVEAQIRGNSCGAIRPVSIGEIDACGSSNCEGPYVLYASFWWENTAELWHTSTGMPSDEVYYGPSAPYGWVGSGCYEENTSVYDTGLNKWVGTNSTAFCM